MLQITLTIWNAHGKHLVNTVTKMNILLIILKLMKGCKTNKELLLRLHSCRNKANIMNNISTSIQDIVRSKIKNDTDSCERQRYH